MHLAIDLERELDRLYGLPLGKFVAARNDLAKRLRKTGDRERADRVKALPKPSLTAWAVNQLAFSAADDLVALEEAGSEVRAAHLEAASQQQAAVKARRAVIAKLLGLVAAHFATQDLTLGRSHRQRIVRTLEALSSRAEGSDEPVAGRLSQDLEPPGFDALADLASALRPVARLPARRPAAAHEPGPASMAKVIAMRPAAVAPTPAPTPVEPPDPFREERRKLDGQLSEQRDAVRGLEEKLSELQRATELATHASAIAEEAANAAAAAAEEAELLAREARERANTAAEGVRRAGSNLEDAVGGLETATTDLDRARDELQGLAAARQALER